MPKLFSLNPKWLSDKGLFVWFEALHLPRIKGTILWVSLWFAPLRRRYLDLGLSSVYEDCTWIHFLCFMLSKLTWMPVSAWGWNMCLSLFVLFCLSGWILGCPSWTPYQMWGLLPITLPSGDWCFCLLCIGSSQCLRLGALSWHIVCVFW